MGRQVQSDVRQEQLVNGWSPQGADGEKGNSKMSCQFKARFGRLVAILLATVAFASLAVQATTALAADPNAQLDTAATAQLLQQLGTSQVDEAICTTLCHGNIAATKNYASSIKFSHGNHIIVQCSSCHTKFPHQANGTQTPTMKGCFDCHGLRHSTMGVVAKGECNACHVTPRWQMSCPWAKNTSDWAGKGHVAPANAQLNTDCARCHTQKQCDTCHEEKGIVWSPKNGYGYDSNGGCQSCHGSSNLLKQNSGIAKSFQVIGVEDSVHRDITCQQCHADFRYDDKPSATKLWNVNAGIACGTCHQNPDIVKQENDRTVVAEYEKSIHAQRIRQGDYNSATCGSCHGGHFIYSLDTDAAKARMHSSALRVCARCHTEQYASYNDYYHGRAYKEGAADAPACWQCHESHNVLPKADPASTVNPANVGETCGQQGCHKGSTEQFGAQAGSLIHRKVEAQATNPIIEFFTGLFKKKS